MMIMIKGGFTRNRGAPEFLDTGFLKVDSYHVGGLAVRPIRLLCTDNYISHPSVAYNKARSCHGRTVRSSTHLAVAVPVCILLCMFGRSCGSPATGVITWHARLDILCLATLSYEPTISLSIPQSPSLSLYPLSLSIHIYIYIYIHICTYTYAFLCIYVRLFMIH